MQHIAFFVLTPKRERRAICTLETFDQRRSRCPSDDSDCYRRLGEHPAGRSGFAVMRKLVFSFRAILRGGKVATLHRWIEEAREITGKDADSLSVAHEVHSTLHFRNEAHFANASRFCSRRMANGQTRLMLS